jgi:hypothetical protein
MGCSIYKLNLNFRQMRKNRGDILRSGIPTNRILYAKATLHYPCEITKSRTSSSREGIFSVFGTTIDRIEYRFQYGCERGYSLKTLAKFRPNFLYQLFNKKDRYGKLLYRFTGTVQYEIDLIIKAKPSIGV